MTLVDTSAWIEFFHPRGDARVKEQLSHEVEEGRVAVCGPVLCELFRGVTLEESQRLRVVFSGFLSIAVLDEDWITVQDLALELKAEGLKPPILDMLLAAVACRSDASLWHFGDRHFQAISRVLRFTAVDMKG